MSPEDFMNMSQEEYYKIGRDRFGIMQYKLKGPQPPPAKRLTHTASSKMPEQLERWARQLREERVNGK